MKLNSNMVVSILLGYEEREAYKDGVSFKDIGDNKDRDKRMEEIKYHIDILEEEGCLAQIKERLRNRGIGDTLFLTLKGHALLEKLRSEKEKGEDILSALNYR